MPSWYNFSKFQFVAEAISFMDKPLHLQILLLLLSSLLQVYVAVPLPEGFSGTKSNPSTTKSTTAVLIQAANTGSVLEQTVGYCQDGRTSVTFTNQGMNNDPALSVIHDLSVGIGLGTNFTVVDGGFEIVSVRIAGVLMQGAGPMQSIADLPAFSTDPDGPGGLTDADNDGFFDDLELGNTVEITATYRFQCTQANTVDPADNCQNNALTSISARLDYFENNQLSSFSFNDFLKPSHEGIEIETFSTPDTYAGLDTFTIEHTITRRIRNFQTTCPNGGIFEIEVTLPTGIVPITDDFQLLKNRVDPIPIIDVQANGASIVLSYDASFSTILSGDYTLFLPMTAECPTTLGPLSVPLSFAHICNDCTCEHLWYCGDLDGPYVHTSNPPCPNEVLLACNEGIQSRSFEVNRLSTGYSDTGFTNLIDISQANQKVALPCDEVNMCLISTIGKSPITDSIGMVINYSNPGGINTSNELFLFQSGTLKITNGDQVFTCPVTDDLISSNATAQNKELVFDLDACLSNLNLTLEEGDSLVLDAVFSINPDGPIKEDFLRVPDLRAYAFHSVDGVRASCDSFGDVFRVGKSRAVYDFPNSILGMPSGCENGVLHYRLFIPENGFVDYFGSELRQAQKIDSFILDFDPVLLQAYSISNVSVSIPGHPIHGNDYFDIRPLSDFPDGHYIASFDTLDYQPSLNIVEEYSFDLMVELTPTCLAAENSNLLLSSNIFYTDRSYANNIGDGSCSISLNLNGNSTLSYLNPISFTQDVLTPTNVLTQGGVAEWTIEICNTSNSAVSSGWFSVEEASGDLNVLSIADISNPSIPVGLNLESFASNDVFVQLSSFDANECKLINLSANLNGCQGLNFEINTGWECETLAPAWTPSASICPAIENDLSITNTGSAPIDLEIAEFTSICNSSGNEELTFTGALIAVNNIPGDNFIISFVYDENEDGAIQNGEPEIGQLSLFGSINPGQPLPFNTSFDASVSQLCHIMAKVEAGTTDLCEGIELALPAPSLENAGNDQFFCNLIGSTVSTSIGLDVCPGSNYTYQWNAVFPAQQMHIGAVNEAVTAINFDGNNFLGDTLRYVLETQRPGCPFPSYDTVQIFMPSADTGFFSEDSIQLQVNDCSMMAEFCLGIPVADISNYEIFVNGLLYPSANYLTCNADQVAVQLAAGEQQLVLTETANGCVDTLTVQVICTSTASLTISLLLNESDTLCLNGTELTGSIASIQNLCLDGSFVSYDIVDDTCIVVTGMLVGVEEACYVACDANNFCDTTFVTIEVQHPIPNGLADTIVITQSDEYCFDESLFNIIGSIDLIENICPQSSGTAVNFNLDPLNACLVYDGLEIGIDTACIRVCDAMGNCDTINYIVSVVPGNTLQDTVFISVDTNVFCIDPDILPGAVFDLVDVCSENNGDQVQFTIENDCVFYFGTALGMDTACIRIVDELGNVALVNLVVTVVQTTPELYCDNIFIGEIAEYCMDTSELPGIYQNFIILFDDETNENVSFDENLVDFCVRYEGLEIGQDSFSIALCDHLGFCDTFSLCLTVDPYFDPPGLSTDSSYTFKETPVVIDPLSNDTVFGGISDYFILDPPISGSAIINLDGSITYIPDPPFCARWDQFTYVVCNPNGCDTTSINVFIECIELTIFNAVSPNNDDVNDYFYIAKIENFPNNRLRVFNRWGNQVFDSGSEGYKNNWPGTWGDDIDLPDGTYYYILEWTDNGITTIQRGYFEMYR